MAVVVSSGCSPPERPLDVGIRKIRTDVIIATDPPSGSGSPPAGLP